jgi:hypothetical protein
MIAEILSLFCRVHFIYSASPLPSKSTGNEENVAPAGKGVEFGDFVGAQDSAARAI